MTEPPPPQASRGLLLGVALVSAATLGVEVLQTRLFSVMLWHHLTYMVVTVTLLGFAAGGSLLAIWPRLGRIGGDARIAVSLCCSLFGLTLIGTFALLAHTPLDTLDIEQDRTKYFWLFLRYAYLVVPFLAAGMAVAIALQQWASSVHRTYFWNLLGSGVGSFLFVLLVRPLGGPALLFVFASLGGLGGLSALGGVPQRRGIAARVLGVLVLSLWPLSLIEPSLQPQWVPIRPARSKAQSTAERLFPVAAQMLRQQDPTYPRLDESLHHTLWTPLCRLDTLPMPPTPQDAAKDRATPAPTPRTQVAVYQDGDAPTVIWSHSYAADRDYDAHFYGLGYRLVHDPRVLVIGPGGGNDVETALHYGAKQVTAVDINGDTLRLVREAFGDYTGHVYERPTVAAVHSEGRSFLRRAGGTYDLIQMSGTDTYAALTSGSYIFSESYLYTAEAFADYFDHLADRGVLSIIRFRFEPPRETLKLIATGASALQRRGVRDLARHFIVVNQTDRQLMRFAEAVAANANDPTVRQFVDDFRAFNKVPMRYSFALMRKEPFSAAEVATIERALQPMNRNPDVTHVLYYGAGQGVGDDNEYGRLLRAMAAGDSELESFYRDYSYHVRPATDDEPFFFNFGSWRDLHPFAKPSDTGYAALTGSENIGTYILAALLLQTLIATFLLVVLPLFRLGFRGAAAAPSRGRILVYFTALGLGYLLVEICTIQRFVLYLGHPTYSLTAGLMIFLLGSGLGSAWAGRRQAGPRFAALAALCVVVGLGLHATLLPRFLQATLALPEAARVALTIAWVGPVAFAMGIPFPTGLRALAGQAPGLIPWAFGVNGAASVLSSILSIVLAMEFGFTVVFAVAAALYALAAGVVLGLRGSTTASQADVHSAPSPHVLPITVRG